MIFSRAVPPAGSLNCFPGRAPRYPESHAVNRRAFTALRSSHRCTGSPTAAIVLAHGQRPDATGAAVVIQGIAFNGAPNSGAAAASLPHNFAFRRLKETSPIDGIGIRRFGRLAPLVNSDSLLPAQGHLGITPPPSTAH